MYAAPAPARPAALATIVTIVCAFLLGAGGGFVGIWLLAGDSDVRSAQDWMLPEGAFMP